MGIEARRPIIRICALAFLCGIFLVQQLSALPSLWYSIFLLPLLLLSLWRPFLLPVLFFFGGIVWAVFRADLILREELPIALEGINLHVEGYITDIPRQTELGVQFEFDVNNAVTNDGVSVRIPPRVLLNSYYKNLYFHAGEHWRLTIRLKRPHGFQNPGGFDYERFLFRNRIRAKGYIRRETAPQKLPSESALYGINHFRQSLETRIQKTLPSNPFAGIIIALANGNNRYISDDQWQVLRTTGTIHLVAISGLHIGLIALWSFFIARRMWSWPGVSVLYLPAPKLGAVCAIFAALCYSALAGFSIPTQRATIMVAVGLGGVLWLRRMPPLSLLAVALFLVLVYDPLAVMASGFWLSFAAVAVIVIAAQGHESRHSIWRRWGKLQCAIALGLIPLMLLLYQQTSLVSPITNLFAIPVFGLVIVPLTLVAAISLITLPETVSTHLLQLATQLLEWIWIPLEMFSKWEYSLWIQAVPSLWTVLAATIGILILLAPRGWPGRWVGTVWMLPLFLLRPPGPETEEVWFTLLDVGQGLSAIVRTRHHTLVFDAGPRFSRRFDTGRAVVVPYLRAKGIGRVDTLVVSHGDNDHVGGAFSVIDAIPIERVLSSIPEQLPYAIGCAAGETWIWDGVEFNILNPPRDVMIRGNNASCVLQIKSRHGNILLPADIEALVEHKLVDQYGKTLSSQILVVPHHGSKSSSTAAFLEAVNPRVALFPAGYRNRYRHPHPQVRARYTKIGANLYDSATAGAIEIQLGDQGTRISGYRQQNRRYWFSE